MQAYLTLTRRELGGYFLSLTGYIVIAATVFLMGFSFVAILRGLQGIPTPMPATELFFVTQFFWLILLVPTPVITMRLFALEKATGTFETLMTTPVSDLQVVLAKFTASLILYIVMWLPLLGYIFILRYYTAGGTPLDGGALGSTFLGIALLGCLFLAAGCCASAMTRSQVTAAMTSLAFGIGFFILSILAGQFTSDSSWQAQALACFALSDQMHDFSRGLVDTRSVILLLSLTLLLLFLTLRIVESRRWK
ncbi:MAG TPA: ABC transporter permease subunit [Candidatus Dormibacteraeota bacterium]|nr:ABC transporter permease subunit [Candidatus Dormibacteraeota bacterium]